MQDSPKFSYYLNLFWSLVIKQLCISFLLVLKNSLQVLAIETQIFVYLKLDFRLYTKLTKASTEEN